MREVGDGVNTLEVSRPSSWRDFGLEIVGVDIRRIGRVSIHVSLRPQSTTKDIETSVER